MSSLSYNIRPLGFNSQCIDFGEWIAILTLCLAPLIVHIVSGAPPPSILSHTLPQWHDNLCHYNPTSIVWRYAAIADRRIRATHWTHIDLAASNAIFWTERGWDGGEEMIATAAPHCLRHPDHSYVRIFSLTSLRTLVTTLQGLAALYTLIGSLLGLRVNWIGLMGVDMIFYPLAVLGLLRLWAGLWLTDDFEYGLAEQSTKRYPLRSLSSSKTFGIETPITSSYEALDPFLSTPSRPSEFKSPNRSIPSIVFRLFFVLLVAAFTALVVVFLTPMSMSENISFSVTSFLVGIFYLFFLLISVVLYAIYFIRGRTTSTLIPCISSLWYKIYTAVLFGLMVVLIVIASVETGKLPNGQYASVKMAVPLKCNEFSNWATFSSLSNYYIASPVVQEGRKVPAYPLPGAGSPKNFTGLTAGDTSGIGENDTLLDDRYLLYNLTGFCVGNFQEAKRK
ncbi:hypothetical protein BU24DRAFT_424499 [Aaosphaeria arxii CBS 175.79]|uniref:Uncharacterized protein n=1 Tax=Aaosphaeria arxii CBS 175.79 TaxID=1450172 RepID=A0A6A5XL05_9PLEO|nr:uncharacterized protein BU24DRAFT_424499 [Aaosphaeria arxii CBS 175.79]KAF2013487.1 hypothetical protein BU24DRAFT_424499 [Aaosphaeria arxii CBS 175.79]